ncbi:MAG: DUF4832 domain-containing protein [Chthoniobacterales bacterium]
MEIITTKPREITDVLTNPGMGWTTFFSFNGDEENKNYPKSSIAYFRLYWDALEPNEGEYRWDIIDKLLETARSRGQRLALRVSAMDGAEWAAKWWATKGDPVAQAALKNYRVPIWFRELGTAGGDFIDEAWKVGTPPMWEPDYGDPLFVKRKGELLTALGARYDGHPDLDHVDIGTVGRWGEWHCGIVAMPPLEIRLHIIDIYLSAFKKTPLLMLIADTEAMEYAISKGTGWRADCLGDCRESYFHPWWEGGTPSWNHMEDLYLQHLVKARALKAWRKNIVAFESCWTMEHWQEKGWPVPYILDYALALHCSVINNKSTPIPEACWPDVEAFSRKVGYRFVLQSLEHPRAAKCGETISISLIWQNKGVAPCYRKHTLTLRLSSTDGRNKITLPLASDVSTWLPGRKIVKESIALPTKCVSGSYILSVALIDGNTGSPAIHLAIEGRDKDGWYPLSLIQIG